MKTKSVMFIFIVALNSFSAQKNNSGVNSQSIKDNEISTSSKLKSPTVLSLTKSPLDSGLSTPLLAPLSGTELALGISQSRLKMSGKLETGKTSGTNDMSLSTISVAHALNKNFFIGTNLSYSQGKGDNEWTSAETGKTSYSTSKTTGVSDPTLTAGGRIDIEKTSLLFSLSAKVKTGDAEDKTILEGNSFTSNSESNSKSGGNALIPSIGIYTSASNGMIFGGLVSYAILSERTSKYTDSSNRVSYTKSTGSNVQKASLFFETPKHSTSFGGSLDYTKIEGGRSKMEYSNFSYVYESDGIAFATLTGFVNIELNNSFAIIPSLSYGRFGEGTGHLDDKDMASANVLAKINF